MGAVDTQGVKPAGRLRRAALILTCAIVALGALVPVANARRVARKAAVAVLPSVYPSGELRRNERVVRVSAHTAANAQMEVFVQVFCFDKQLRVHRRKRTVTGTGQVRARLRKPGTYKNCTASASVEVTSRPLPPSGQLPAPIRLRAALYARR